MSKITQYKGGCLCGQTTYIATAQAINPHLCSCTMCQKSSGSPTVAWVSFPLENFQWTNNKPNFYKSSKITGSGLTFDISILRRLNVKPDPVILATLKY